jgi:hypothetical protein
MERWQSGRMRWLAKPLMESNPSEGSNPSFSAPQKVASGICSRTRLFVFFILLLSLSGCIKRQLVIRTSPSDSRVFLDGIEVENSSGIINQDFTFHGTRNLVVRHRGYQTKGQMWDIEPPWYSEFPIDFFTELLVPWTIEEDHEISVTLERLRENNSTETKGLIKRARDLAKEAGSELR